MFLVETFGRMRLVPAEDSQRRHARRLGERKGLRRDIQEMGRPAVIWSLRRVFYSTNLPLRRSAPWSQE